MVTVELTTAFGPEIDYDGPLGIITFFEHKNGSTYAYNIPSYFNVGPLIPSYSYKKEGISYSAGVLIEDFQLGNMRDWTELGTTETGDKQYVLVDHGLELGSDYADWPHGHIYIATEIVDGFEFTQITEHKAFYHSVSTGDVNGDALPDIVASHMGSNFGATFQNINIFIQQDDGSFVEDLSLIPAIGSEAGTGGVLVTDLDGDDNEIIEVAYGKTYFGEYAVKIYSGNANNGFQLSARIAPSGLFDTMGGTRIRDIDYDRDGDSDFVISLEGAMTTEEQGYTGNGLHIISNTGGETPFYSTTSLLEEHAWYFSELQFREFEVVDFDFDGWLDIVLHAWSGDRFMVGQNEFDLGPALFRNIEGKRFEQLSDITFSYSFEEQQGHGSSMLRFVGTDVSSQTAEFFMLVNSWGGKNAPLSVYMRPSYRDNPETLLLRNEDDYILGMGGDDVFIAEGGGSAIGGPGVDTVEFSAPFNSFTAVLNEAEVEVLHRDLNGDKSYSLSEVERLQFGNQSSDFELAKFMGSSSLTPSELESIIELYIAYYNRSPDALGLNFWGTAFVNGLTLAEIAAKFAPQPETVATYPAGTSSTDFATAVYANVLGRVPDQAGLEFWVGELDSGGVSRDQFVLAILRGVADTSADRAYLDNKTDVGAYFSVHKGMSDAENAQEAMALYDGTQISIDAAVSAIDNFYQAALNPVDGEFLLKVVGVLDNTLGD